MEKLKNCRKGEDLPLLFKEISHLSFITILKYEKRSFLMVLIQLYSSFLTVGRCKIVQITQRLAGAVWQSNLHARGGKSAAVCWIAACKYRIFAYVYSISATKQNLEQGKE
jgi:hypothetical protein